MSKLPLIISPPVGTCHKPQRHLTSASSAFNWSRGREAEILTQKINSRFVELEKDGAEAIKDLGKLCRWVEGMVGEAKMAVEEFGTAENLRKSYQDVSKVLVEAEVNVAMLTACVGQWQNTGEFSATEPRSSLHDGTDEEVKKESEIEMLEQMDKNDVTESTLAEKARICVEEKPVNSVLVVHNLDVDIMNCNRLFNLISPYANIRSIKFFQVSEFPSALVEVDSNEGAQRVLTFLKDVEVFGQMLKIEPLSTLNVAEYNRNVLPSLPNGTPANGIFSQFYRYYRPTRMYPPSRTLTFHNTPNMTDEQFYEIFDGMGAPRPYRIVWFKTPGLGCLNFKSKAEAIKAICIANTALTKIGSRRINLAFTYVK